MIIGMITVYLLSFLWTKSPIERIKKMVPICSQVCKFGLKALNIQVTLNGFEILNKFSASDSFLIISNHLSYLDVLVITAHLPSSFVTSIETKSSFILGPICRAGGSLFVERRKKFTLKKEIEMIKEVLCEGIRVCIFPEATSSDGKALLPFKKALLESAFRAQKPILPLCLQYKKINNQTITNENKDLVYYYGEMTFFPHLIGLLKVHKLEVVLSILDPVHPPYTENSRSEVGEHLFHEISRCYAS